MGVVLPYDFDVAFGRDRVARLLVDRAQDDLLSFHQTDEDEFELSRYRQRLRDRVLAFPLPPQLSFLHYVTRPVRLTKVYGAGWMKSVVWDDPE